MSGRRRSRAAHARAAYTRAAYTLTLPALLAAAGTAQAGCAAPPPDRGAAGASATASATADPSASRPSAPTTAPMPSATLPPHEPADTLALADVLPLLEQVDPEHARLLRANPGPVTYAPLPFYPDAGLARAEARLPTRPVLMRYVYLPRARQALPLGTPERVRQANEAAGLRLTAETVRAYVNFYLEAAGGAPPPRQIVERADDVRWMPDAGLEAAERAARDKAAALVRPAEVAARPDGGFTVTATAVRAYALETVTFVVSPDGAVREERATTLMDGLPIVVGF